VVLKMIDESRPLKIFFGATNKAPYDNHAGALALSTFNAAVRGQLIVTDEFFNLKPGLLQEYRFDANLNRYVLRLAPNLIFHNGRRANSLDLEFSLLRGFYTEDKSFFYTYLYSILGLNEVVSSRFESGAVKGVKCHDELTLHVQLERPNPTFLNTLAVPFFSLVPREELEEDFMTWKKAPIGVGPYMVTHPFDGQKTIIERVEKEASGPRTVWFLANLENDKADIALEKSAISSSIASSSPLLSGNIRVLEFSRINPLSSNKNFRKAVNLLIDRKAFNNVDLGTSETDQMLPQYFRKENITLNASLDEARKYLDSIPKEILKQSYEAIIFSGPKLSEKNKFFTQKLENLFNLLDLNIKFVPNEEKFISKEIAQKSPISMFGMVCDYTDPLIMFSAYRVNSHAEFYLPDSEIIQDFENLYVTASKSQNFSERIGAIKRLSDFTRENAIVVSIAEEKTIFYYDSTVIKHTGKQIHPITLLIENLILH
jgi:ABC-type oligopeptide transport system substrate-binding subunit